MTDSRHGLSIGIDRMNEQFFITLKAVGKLTHADYEKITPLINSALESVEDPKVKAYLDASELEGWELRAAWDDFKIGLKHGREFKKVAIFGNQKWLEVGSKIGSWFMSGEVKFFDSSESALEWLHS